MLLVADISITNDNRANLHQTVIRRMPALRRHGRDTVLGLAGRYVHPALVTLTSTVRTN
jgi:hypothetical protein